MKTTMKTAMKSSPRLGVSAVEAALLIPLVMMLLMGMLEYGWAFLKIQQINGAARHGARIGIVDDGTAAEVTAAVSTLMTESGLDTSGYVLTLVPADPLTLLPGEIFNVSIQIAYPNIELFGIPLIPTPAAIRGSTSMVREGPL